MKLTKTEIIEVKIIDLPKEVYAELIPHACEGIEPWFSTDGIITLYHEWDSDAQFDRGWPLSDLVNDAIERGYEQNNLASMLVEVEKAAAMLRGALTPNT